MATKENDYEARWARVVRLEKKRGLERKGVRRRETRRARLATVVAEQHAAYVPVVKGRVRGFIDGVGTVAVYIIVSVILLSLWLGLWQPVDSQ